MALVIGGDCGGTNLRLGLVDQRGQVLQRLKVFSRRGSQPFHQRIIKGIDQLLAAASLSRKDILGVGIGLPGIVDLRDGVVWQSPHFPEWKRYALRAAMGDEFHLPFFINNDANCILLGEHWTGVARSYKHVCLITLGSGIGGAALIDGALLTGVSGMAGEFGHMTLEAQGPPCKCGSRGCFEMYCSNTGIVQMARDLTSGGLQVGDHRTPRIDSEDFDVKALAEAAQRGDSGARHLFTLSGRYLGIGVASLLNAFNPEALFIGGGVAAAYPWMEAAMREEIAGRAFPRIAEQAKVSPCVLGDDAGIIGAARWAFEQTGTPLEFTAS